MKEVTLFSDDAKSKESAQQLGQVSCPGSYVGIVSFKNMYFFDILTFFPFGVVHFF